MHKLLVIFSLEAHGVLEELNENTSSFKNQDKITLDGTVIHKGYDYDIKEFKSQEEVDAYILGLEDGNGWSDDVWFEKL